MVELNAAGWSALLTPPALAGGVASIAAGWHPTVGALAGAGAALVVAVAWDRWRWRNSVASVSSDLGLEELRQVADRLRAERIDVTVDAADPGPVVAPDSDREDVDHWRLTTRQRRVNHVLAALDAPAARPPTDEPPAGKREQVREFRREQLREFDGVESCRHRSRAWTTAYRRFGGADQSVLVRANEWVRGDL